ncbi:hypothetical protein BGZ73_003578 [Actinomortierella ambigua]|nr:hypothetical protein BGZ73_003578 [Actinomortierella ambigua]
MSIAKHTLRHRRPILKDTREKQQRIRQLDEAILHGDIPALQRLSVTGTGFVNDGRHRDEFEEKPSKDEDQGFHDVCTCLITVLGKESATLAAECVALVFLRDCMLDNLEPVLDQLSLMMGLFRLEDPEVLEFLNRSDTLPFFALSWVITWCAHDLQDFRKVARVFDFFLCHNPLMPVYFAAAVVMSRREELFQQECDNAMVHTFLTKFPKNCDLELIISHAHQLYQTYPPETLQRHTQSWLDVNSCVNTFNKSSTRLYEPDDHGAKDRPMDFSGIVQLLSQPRIKRPKEESALSKYSERSLSLYQRNVRMLTVVSVAGTAAAYVLINSAFFKYVLF